jgi:hypothetical protein
MSFTTIQFQNKHTGSIALAPVGFSWTVLFFGFFPPILRKDWKWAFIVFFAAIFSWGFSNLLFAFIYNKSYIKGLFLDGYKLDYNPINNENNIDLNIMRAQQHLKLTFPVET